MRSNRAEISETAAPNPAESALALKSSEQLIGHLKSAGARSRLYVRRRGEETAVDLPRSALRLLAGALAEMGKGNAVIMAPVDAELTTNQAAALLGVSRPFLVRLLDENKIPSRKVGTHRRVVVRDVLSYKRRSRKDRLKALESLATQAQELDMGY